MKALIVGLVIETMAAGVIAYKTNPAFYETVQLTTLFLRGTVQSL